jgi:hypothetical protein
MENTFQTPSDSQINKSLLRSRYTDTKNVSVRFTGSIVDEEIAEALEDAFKKHGYNLVNILREL